MLIAFALIALLPYLTTWILYFQFLDMKLTPRQLFNNTQRVYKLFVVVIKMIIAYLFGPPLQIALLHMKYWWNQSTINQYFILTSQQIEFGSKNNNTRLDVYPSSKQNQPVLIFFYGGGWNSGSKRLYSPIAHNLVRNGING